jgi:transposase
MHSGKTVLSQLMMFKSDFQFQRCVERYKGNFRSRRFTCSEHFLVMSFAQLTGRESLRDIESSLTAFSSKLYHSGLRSATAKSTLAEANEKRSWRIYADYAQILIKQARPLYANDPSFRLDIDNMVYALDSSTIDLCLSLFPWAKFRKTKGAVKMHTLLDLRGSIPIYVDITNGCTHDVNILDTIPIEAGSYYIMDKGYLDFKRLYEKIHKQQAFFVTRSKDNINYEVVESHEVDKDCGVLEDLSIRLTGYYSVKKYPEELRIVTYEDFSDGKLYYFLTNNFSQEALTIAELYRERWKIELFFKWIKQHLRIKAFYGTSENAVNCQIWIAICTYLLAAIAKKKLDIPVSLYTFTQTLSLTLFEKTHIKELFSGNINLINPSDHPILPLWEN